MISDSWDECLGAKAFLLGLSRYSFRRDYSASLLKGVGFTNLELVDAYDGYLERPKTDTDLRALGIELPERLGYGHRGCILSHIGIWQRIVREELPYAFVFEDDVIPHPAISKGLGQEYLRLTSKTLDIVYIGNMMNPADPQIYDASRKVIESPTYTTHAYMITLEGAKKLLSIIPTMNQPIDMWLYELQCRNYLFFTCWNGVNLPKPYPVYREDLPWQFFPNVLLPQKDTGLFYQNFRLGSTLCSERLTLDVPQYQR